MLSPEMFCLGTTSSPACPCAITGPAWDGCRGTVRSCVGGEGLKFVFFWN